MAADASRLTQIFVWREGTAPDLDYARHVMSAANPAVAEVLATDDPPITLLAIPGEWPDEPWARAIADLRSIPAPGGTRWDDTSSYDLAGWEGTDLRTGARLFAVTAYRRAQEQPAFAGRNVSAPRGITPPVSQVPYYPQRPTGPLGWPPASTSTPSGQVQPEPIYQSPAVTGLSTPPVLTSPLDIALHGAVFQSYAPYYVNFGRRLAAGLLDLVFIFLIQAAAVVGVLWKGPTTESPYLSDPLGVYAISFCLSLITFAIYHVAQWAIWGQTLGKRLLGIRVVRADGGRPSIAQALVRMVGYVFSLSLAGVGFLLIALDPRRQGLHDKLAETFVIPETPTSPAPAGLPGYGPPPIVPQHPASSALSTPTQGLPATVGMAAVGNQTSPSIVQIAASAQAEDTSTTLLGPRYSSSEWMSDAALSTIPDLTLDPTDSAGGAAGEAPAGTLSHMQNDPADANTPPWGTALSGPVTDMNLRARQHQPDLAERARALFKAGLAALDEGAEPGMAGFKMSGSAARKAVAYFREALDLVPSSVAYRYFYAVALRYAEGFDIASREFREVLEVDPTHYEARQQIAYGPRWHDAFAYPAWVSPAPVAVSEPLPRSIVSALPDAGKAATRLMLLREGGNKVAAFLSRTVRADWTALPTLDMPARLQLKLTRTPYGPILALYVIVEDNPQNPFIGETFLNPHDPPQLLEDACQMGQHLLAQLARQDRTYLIFADEDDRLLLSRKLAFDSATQVSLARTFYEVQSLPPQVMPPDRFSQAAQWHMQNFPLDQAGFTTSA